MAHKAKVTYNQKEDVFVIDGLKYYSTIDAHVVLFHAGYDLKEAYDLLVSVKRGSLQNV